MAKNLEIDLADPRVQQLLGHEEGGIVAPENGGRRSMVTLAGDHEHGMQSVMSLDIGKSVVAVWYRDKELILELDVFALPGESIKVHAICPRCHHHLTIGADRKKIEWDPRSENPYRKALSARLPPASVARSAMGKISIETFECTWEMNTQQKVSGDLTVGKGNLCRWRATIDNNLVREG